MSDLINRADAINAMCNKVCGVDYCGCATDCNEIKGIMELPSAGQIMTATSNTVVSDTVQIPVMDGTTERLPTAERKGTWLRYGEDGYPNEEDTVFWQCDQCLEQYTGRTTRIPNYCPNCGADMRGEEE